MMKLNTAVSLLLTVLFSIWLLGLGTYAVFKPVLDTFVFAIVVAGLVVALGFSMWAYIVCQEAEA